MPDLPIDGHDIAPILRGDQSALEILGDAIKHTL